jgi:hypothetical protein
MKNPERSLGHNVLQSCTVPVLAIPATKRGRRDGDTATPCLYGQDGKETARPQPPCKRKGQGDGDLTLA